MHVHKTLLCHWDCWVTLSNVIDTVESDPRLVQLDMSLVDLKGKMRYNPLMGEHINCDWIKKWFHICPNSHFFSSEEQTKLDTYLWGTQLIKHNFVQLLLPLNLPRTWCQRRQWLRRHGVNVVVVCMNKVSAWLFTTWTRQWYGGYW